MSEKLKNCPFCGAAARKSEVMIGMFVCPNIDCGFDHIPIPLETWNTRTDPRKPGECQHFGGRWKINKITDPLMTCRLVGAGIPVKVCPCAAWAKKEK